MAVTTGGQASTGTAPLPSEITPQETVPAQALSIRNKLLFAQAVHRLGAPVGKSVGNNWNAVVSLLRDSPALSEEEKAVFTEHNCRGFYDDLMAEAGFGDLSTLAGLEKPNAKPHLVMAQWFYVQRMKEMKATIEDQEHQFLNLISEIEAIKSGEAVYNPKLMAELHRAILQVRADVPGASSADALRDWAPTKEELQAAARGESTSSVTATKPQDVPVREPADKIDTPAISPVFRASPAPAASAVVSPSPTPTPTPSVVVNGEILKSYPPSEIQSTNPIDEVPPLQIQPKRPKEVIPKSVDPLQTANGAYEHTHGQRQVEVKQEPIAAELPPKPAAIRQDLSKAARNATASPSPPVSEQATAVHTQRIRPSMEIKTTPTSASRIAIEAVSQTSTPIKGEFSNTAQRPDRVTSAGVYNHRKIPVKNAASHSVTSGPSLMGDKRPVVMEEPPVVTEKPEADVIVPDSQEVPDSQDEAGPDEAIVKVSLTGPSATTTASSPRKATRATRNADVTQTSSVLPNRSSERDRQSDEESNRSELTTPPASPALSAPPSSIERKVKNEDDSADTDMLSPVALSPVALQNPSTAERKARRAVIAEDATGGLGNRGRKRGRESEGGAPSTPAKRPYQRSSNNQSQDGSSPVRKAEDSDDDDKKDGGPTVARRGRPRRTSTRGKPSTIGEDSEDSGHNMQSAERPGRKRGAKDDDQASRSSAQRRSGRFARASSDKHNTNTDDTVNEDDSDKADSKVPRRRGRPAKNTKETQDDTESDTTEDERDSEQPERIPKSAPKTQESKKDAQPLPGESREELGKNDAPDDMDTTTPNQDRHPLPTGRTRSTRSAAKTAPPVMSIKAFQTMINPLYEEIIAHKNGPLFLAPVRESDAPGYSKIVKQPMDLKRIKTKIRKGEISSIDEFQRDLLLIFCNAMLYNRPNSEVYRMAQEMMVWCEQKINDYRNLQHHIRQNS